ncbi:MAG: PhzF family phenazine biosynthesis protein [Firmicutes bacterium]|nr:PhzF family phenazine biosynthesis protein [Bacillota bacterium]
MTVPIYQVDAFTSQAFAGNPAAVCVLDEERKDEWLQAVAAEMNLSETAFVLPGPEGYALRWFTPTVEVDLCGHATLATAHALYASGRAKPGETLRFATRSGPLSARQHGGQIILDFPAEPATSCAVDDGLLAAIGIKPLYSGRNREDFLFEIASEAELVKLKPDFARLAALTERGAIVTARSQSSKYDFVSRFFAPGIGIDEDPVTGSAHCCLAPYWQQKMGKTKFQARQLSSRGGELQVEVQGERVLLFGQAVLVFCGEILV